MHEWNNNRNVPWGLTVHRPTQFNAGRMRSRFGFSLPPPMASRSVAPDCERGLPRDEREPHDNPEALPASRSMARRPPAVSAELRDASPSKAKALQERTATLTVACTTGGGCDGMGWGSDLHDKGWEAACAHVCVLMRAKRYFGNAAGASVAPVHPGG